MKFATRLYVGFAILIVMMSILLLVNINIQSRQSEEIKELVKENYHKIKLLNEIREDVFFIHADLEGEYTSETDNNLKSINEILTDVHNNINTLIEMSSDANEKQDFNLLKAQIEDFEQIVENINEEITELVNIERTLLLVARHGRDSILSNITTLIENQETVMDRRIEEAEQRLSAAVNSGILSIALGVILGIALSFWSIRTITIRLNRLKEVMKSVEHGSEQLLRITVTRNDEIGEIATVYNEMASSLETHQRKERIYKENIEQQNSIKTKLAELSIISQGIYDLKSLGQEFIQAIIPAVNANHGVIYLKIEKGNHSYLNKLASYANVNAKEKIEKGEGLVGQCLQDGMAKKLTNIQDEYIRISSGLWEAPPSSILIIPVKLDGEVLAVIELASLQVFSDTHESFLQQTSEQLASTIIRIQKQIQVSQLLDETKTLNDELQNQSEELQLQQEELKTMNEELESQYRKSEKRTTDLQQAKAALEEKTKQVLLSSQYKSEFLANMSHELRTPLNSLLILAQILVENKDGNLTNKQMEYAHTIYTSGKDLLDLINDILDLSKIESGKLDFHLGEFDLAGVVSFVKNQFSAMAEQKGINFEVEIEDNVPTILYSDEQKIYQVLKNLVSNALKFTEKGSVQLRVYKPMPEQLQNKQERIAFAVHDTGIGISNEKQALIFEAFQQADGTTSRKFGGTGLGLSISKGMADLIGGSIILESEEGKGSTFTFYVPLHLNDSAESIQEVASTVEETFSPPSKADTTDLLFVQEDSSDGHGDILKGKNILLVDDDMRNVFALTTALEDVGINVWFAENGRESIEILEEKPEIDLILMDIMMPEMDGYEAIMHIRSSTKHEQLPIIALTAKAMKDDREKCLKAGASDYISKPLNLEQLLSLLKVWLYK